MNRLSLAMKSVIPCQENSDLKKRIEEFADVLRVQAHTLGHHGLTEDEFYRSGLFQGAIERIRGQFSATMIDKRDFVRRVLDFMKDEKFIADWEGSGGNNRHDYLVLLNDGRKSVIELKGCLDGNNTNIFERPAYAEEFLIWSVCSNPGANPRRNVWSGIHTRLSAEIVTNQNKSHVDGLIVWDWLCGTAARTCPKLERESPVGPRLTTVGPFKLPPPCIYLFPKTIPEVRNNPNPNPHALADVGFLQALNECFGGDPDEVSRVQISVAHRDASIVRTTTIDRGGEMQKKSEPTPIKRR